MTACVLWALPKGKKKQEKRRFGTFTQDRPCHAGCHDLEGRVTALHRFLLEQLMQHLRFTGDRNCGRTTSTASTPTASAAPW